MPVLRPSDAQPVAHFTLVGFNLKIGHRVVAWAPGFIELALEMREDLLNASGVTHGGVLMTLLDAACGLAASYEGPDKPRRLCRTLSFTTHFINPGRDGLLTIRGQKRGSGRNTFVCEAEIVDQQEELLATGTGTFRYIAKQFPA